MVACPGVPAAYAYYLSRGLDRPFGSASGLCVCFGIVDCLCRFAAHFGHKLCFVPWAVFELLAGKVALGIGLLVLTAILWVLRNFTEPKIVGKQLGIHPVISLISMFAGIKLLGFIGIFLGPAYRHTGGYAKPKRAYPHV